MNQTAIEWLYEICRQREPDRFDWEQAKRMEQDQIETAFLHGMTHSEDYFDPTMDGEPVPEQRNYYNQTFKNTSI